MKDLTITAVRFEESTNELLICYREHVLDPISHAVVNSDATVTPKNSDESTEVIEFLNDYVQSGKLSKDGLSGFGVALRYTKKINTRVGIRYSFDEAYEKSCKKSHALVLSYLLKGVDAKIKSGGSTHCYVWHN